MDKRTFEKILKSPSEISPEEAVLLEELAQEFPYCQMAHLLIANESYQKKSMHYPKKLRRASTYVLDRTVLHSLLHAKKRTLPPIPISISEPVISPEINSEVTLVNDKNIQLLSELEINLQELKRNKDAFENNTQNVEEQEVEIPIIPIESFPVTVKPYEPESRLGEEISENEDNISLLLDYLQKAHSTNSILIEQKSTIDKFIELQPKINQRIASVAIEPLNQDLSISSTELKLELVTENFAQILTKQNKFDKAIEVYKKLMLKYPDKSAYFAAKLNELESK